MNCYLDPTEQYPEEATKWAGMNPVMRVLEEVFNPEPTTISVFRDSVLISLDLEYDTAAVRLDQFGVATLDTRNIYMADTPEQAKYTLSSRLILLRQQGHKKGKYLFGQPENHYNGNLKRTLRSIFTIIDPRTTDTRNIILVGHGIRSDILEIRRCIGLNLLELPTIKAVVDTSPLMYRVFHHPGRHLSLRKTCTLLNMYRPNIHTAGNDAMYTLKALLLIFVYYEEEKRRRCYITGASTGDGEEPADRESLYECQLEALRQIGRCNNGIDKFADRRRKRSRDRRILFRAEREANGWIADLLSDSEDEGVVDQLFMGLGRE